MRPQHSQQRQLNRIATELLSDDRFAALFALFADQPVHSSRTGRPARLALVTLMLLVVGAIPACLVAARITGSPAFLTGTVLIVPASVLFGRCCRDSGRSRPKRLESR
jgi:hypothetical protein